MVEKYIHEQASSFGFDFVRIIKAEKLLQEKIFFQNWLKKGYAGSMKYLKKDPEKRSNPEKILPGAKNIICLGLNYFQDDARPKGVHAINNLRSRYTKRSGAYAINYLRSKILECAKDIKGGEFKIARYALGRDYHKVLKGKLKKLIVLIKEYIEKNTKQNPAKKTPAFHFSTDTAPIFERSFAEKAGIGFIGKNSCIITREFGSYVFLSQIITTLDLVPDEPTKWKAGCGTCRRCIDICPTKAILADRTIDATRCIAYLTIENRGPIPVKFREKIGTRLFGCDLCQEICPHNIRAKPTQVEDFRKIRIGAQIHTLKEILEIKNEQEFKKIFAGTPLIRAKHAGLMRNACIVAGNLKEKSLIPSLKKISKESNKMLREHAQWAIEKILSARLKN